MQSWRAERSRGLYPPPVLLEGREPQEQRLEQ